jgi:hypothetical protein
LSGCVGRARCFCSLATWQDLFLRLAQWRRRDRGRLAVRAGGLRAGVGRADLLGLEARCRSRGIGSGAGSRRPGDELGRAFGPEDSRGLSPHGYLFRFATSTRLVCRLGSGFRRRSLGILDAVRLGVVRRRSRARCRSDRLALRRAFFGRIRGRVRRRRCRAALGVLPTLLRRGSCLILRPRYCRC